MIVIVLTAAVALGWGLHLTAACLLGRRTRTYRIETMRPAPPLPALHALHGTPAGVDAGQDRIRAERLRYARGEAPWLRN